MTAKELDLASDLFHRSTRLAIQPILSSRINELEDDVPFETRFNELKQKQHEQFAEERSARSLRL